MSSVLAKAVSLHSREELDTVNIAEDVTQVPISSSFEVSDSLFCHLITFRFCCYFECLAGFTVVVV